MFARFRNLFSKNKNESEVQTGASFGNLDSHTEKWTNTIDPNDKSTKLEGLNFLKTLVEDEQKIQSKTTNEIQSALPDSLSREAAGLFKKSVSENAKKININTPDSVETKGNNEVAETRNDNLKENSKHNVIFTELESETNAESKKHSIKSNLEVSKEKIFTETTNPESPEPDDLNKRNISNEYKEISAQELNKQGEMEAIAAASISIDLKIEPENNIITNPNVVTQENSLEPSESSKSLSQSSVKENYNHSTTQSSLEDFATNLCNNFSIVVEDLPSEITTPSSTVESTLSGNSSNTSTLESSSYPTELSDPSKIIINPIDNNGLACNAITNKLNDIAEVAESLDAIIRDVQESVQAVEVEAANPSSSHKKVNAPRSASSEDWHSRSTEDDSFVTASEGNFTPSSSSFQTASGRTSSYISCDKNSFDASEADDSTFAFEMPELTSPLNMSLEGSEHSYLSAQPPDGDFRSQHKQKTSPKLSAASCQPASRLEEYESSIADIEELHSESVTPTPEQNYDAYHVESIAIESETELEVAGISDAPSMEILTEHTQLPMSRTPEVSSSITNGYWNQNPLTTQTSVNVVSDSNDQQEQQSTTTNNNNNKPNAAWRRSKYYENITKQTIKGFL